MKVFVAVAVLFLSLAAQANWKDDFQELKSVPRDYTDAGSICEEVARLDMKREYPAPQYTVEVGIAYSNEERTIGELDVVIFDNNTQKVYKVAEVKCWRDVRGGLKKAKEQRARFINTVHSNEKLMFRSTSTGRRYDAEQFRYVADFFAIAQKGSEKQGFDHELEYTLSELHQYRKEMIHCQSQGKCAQPPRH